MPAAIPAVLTFAGRTFRGTPESPRWTPPQLQSLTLKFWGTIGEGRINGQRGGHDIFVPAVLHGKFANCQVFESNLKQLNAMVGTVGTLKIVTQQVGYLFERPWCSFEGWMPDGDASAGPFFSPNGNIQGWWQRGALLFRCLRDIP